MDFQGLFMPDFDKPTPRPAAGADRPMQVSRRDWFTTIIGGAAILGAALSLGKTERAEAQAKVSQKTVGYQETPKSGQDCKECRYFLPPNGCQLVAGNIVPYGWCKLFAKKTA
jgi:hypothetical protein